MPTTTTTTGTFDRELVTLCVDRRRLLREYASILKRVGASHDDRSKINQLRAQRRSAHRRALRRNAELIAARVMELIKPEKLRDTANEADARDRQRLTSGTQHDKTAEPRSRDPITAGYVTARG